MAQQENKDDLRAGGQVPDPLGELYQGLLLRVEGLSEVPMQSAVVAETLEQLAPSEAAWCIDQVLRGAMWGENAALEAMMAMSWWLIDLRIRDDYERLKDLFVAAHYEERPAVVDLIREVPPHRSLPKGRGLPEVRLPMNRDVTLGERRSIASGPDRRFLERLLMDPSPLVIGKLLSNPQIRLQDVLVIATRRPTMPELLIELVTHPRWFRRYEVREAVVRNPFGDTGLALKLLPTMRVKTLRNIMFSGDLHPLIQESARRLVLLREERTAPWRV